MNTDTTKRYRLLINLPDGATIGDTYKKVGDRYFNESLDAIKSPVVEHNSYFTWQVENCPTYFEEVLPVSEPVKERIEIGSLNLHDNFLGNKVDTYWYQFCSNKVLDGTKFYEISNLLERYLNGEMNNPAPSALNDTVVEDKCLFDGERINKYLMDEFGQTGKTEPLRFQKRYSQKEVDTIRKEAFEAGRHRFQITSCGTLGAVEFRYPNYSDYLSSLNLNANDTGNAQTVGLEYKDGQITSAPITNDTYEGMRVGEDMICPVTQKHCDDECCPVGAVCNLSSDDCKPEQPTNDNAFVDEHYWEQELHKCKINPYYYATKYLTVNGQPFTTRLTETEFNDEFNRGIGNAQSKQSPPLSEIKEGNGWEICAVRDRDGKLFYTDMLPEKGETIEAVKRLKDNVVFSVGDEVGYDNGNTRTKKCWKIDNFFIRESDNVMLARSYDNINVEVVDKWLFKNNPPSPTTPAKDIVEEKPETISSNNNDVACLSLNDVMEALPILFPAYKTENKLKKIVNQKLKQ